MKAPRCCGESMVKWQHTIDELDDGGRRIYAAGPNGASRWCVWRCQECDKEKPLYRWPWTWLWLRVGRDDLRDGSYQPHWWLGRVSLASDLLDGAITLAPMPLNVVIGYLVAAFHWVRHGVTDKFVLELERNYYRGLADGRAKARVDEHEIASRAAAEEREEWSRENAYLRRVMGLVVIAAGGEVKLSRQLLKDHDMMKQDILMERLDDNLLDDDIRIKARWAEP